MSGGRGPAASLPRLGLDDVLAATARPVPPVPGQSSLDDVPPEPLRIGSLFTGYGGLDMGVQMVLPGRVVWHCQYEPPDKNGRPDPHQYAARILAHHWPLVPNLGDITAVDWQRVRDELGPIDILTGGFPCTDLSLAGEQAGLMAGTRSGLWSYMLRAAEILRPRLMVIENVRGILSTQADSGVDGCPCCVEHAGGKPLLRALGAVLGDLAGIGFDAEWEGVRASDVKAPHERFREFVLAWPSDAESPGLEGRGVPGPVAERRDQAAPDAAHFGHERGGTARDERARPANGDLSAPDASGDGRREGGPESARQLGRSDAAERSGAAAADAASERHRDTRASSVAGIPAPVVGSGVAAAADTDRSGFAGYGELSAGRHAVRQGVGEDAHGRDSAAADADRDAVRQQPVPEPGGSDPAVARRDGERSAADADRVGRDQDERDVRAGQPDVEWGDYEPAIRQWETVLGRNHPWPTDDRGRLAPELSEWMQGVPAGHVCSVPGAPGMSEAALRNARLKALGNGVVPLQSAYAVGLLLGRVQDEPAIRWLLDRAFAVRIAA
ncbi:DNA cytosine methyltransferase [Streptomyces sp. 35M1]|uniref:DNA cytosine methyltransferase n=1 Tax=Streptomyces sp. 35M1 TaxID=3142978 RepID=UPI0039909A40